MAYKKKSSSHYNKAVTRLASLKSIDTKMDLGNGLDIAVYEAAVSDLRTKIDDYNTHLSQVDEKKNLIASSEQTLRDLSERMLSGVASKFGKNSDEYEKAGGVKKSERKKAVRTKRA
jgi:hypothetical protein